MSDHARERMDEGVACPNCNGQGEVRGPQAGMPFFPCRFCHGGGVVSTAKADDWHFEGDWL